MNTSLLKLSMLLALTSLVAVAQSKQTNILVILTDDLGYSTTSAFANQKNVRIETPNIDRIANEGAKFTNGYVTANVCGPSRSGLLTGKYQQRFGVYANLDTQKGPGVPGSEKVMHTYFKEAGYRTAAIGKWHIGTKQKGQHPLDRGIDTYYGFNSAQTDYFNSPILFNGKEKVKKHDYLTFQFTEEAIKFIEQDKKTPFFMYLAYNAVHSPMQAPKAYIEKYSKQGFPGSEAKQMAMVEALDESIGKLLNTLEKNNLDKNTLIFFMSDNGGLPGWWIGNNAPWKGFKREQWEGGYHVQFMMKWPGKIPAGQVRSEMVFSLDVLTTSLAAANIEKPKNTALDGKNILPVFKSKKKKEIHECLFWAGTHVARKAGGKENIKKLPYKKSDAPAAWSVRTGKWKLVQMMEYGNAKLYDLDKDPAENNDVYKDNPKIVKQLSKEFANWFKDLAEPFEWNKKYYNELKQIQ